MILVNIPHRISDVHMIMLNIPSEIGLAKFAVGPTREKEEVPFQGYRNFSKDCQRLQLILIDLLIINNQRHQS